MKRSRPAGDPSGPREEGKHPSLGGSIGYDPLYRALQLELHASGLRQFQGASASSLSRWRRNGTGRKAMTGNHAPDVFGDEHDFLLSLCRLVWPKATTDEARAFIAQYASDNRLFTREQICRRQQERGYSRVRASTQAVQAFTPINIVRAFNFWNQPFPFGCVGLLVPNLIDMDEAGFWLEKFNRSYAVVKKGQRGVAPGPYGHAEKWTIIAAICGDGRRWITMEKVPGTTAEKFHGFVHGKILTGPEAIAAAPTMTLLWDNLRAHSSAMVTNAVLASGHQYLARPPYRPCDGPIEYVFNVVEQELRVRIGGIQNENDLYREVMNIFGGLDPTSFARHFAHCGY